MKDIALLSYSTTHDNDGYPNYEWVCQNITDFYTISDEDFEILRKYVRSCPKMIEVCIVERKDRDLPRTVKEAVEWAKKDDIRKALEAKEREEKKAANKLKKEQKAQEKEKQILAELQKKYGGGK